MRYKIGILTKEQGYIERLAMYLKQRHGDELLLYYAESIESLRTQINPDKLQLLLVEKESELQEAVLSFPRLVYLTGQQEKETEREICKYQRAETIFEAMMMWVHFFEEEETQDLLEKEGRIVLPYEGALDMAALEIISSVGEKLGLLIPKVEKQTFVYDARGCVCLETFLKKSHTRREGWRMVGQLCTLLSELEEYLLRPDCVLLEQTYIYYEEQTASLRFIYMPLETDRELSQDALEQVLTSMLGTQKRPVEEKNEKQELEEARTCVFQNLQLAAEQSKERILRRKAGETIVLMERDVPHLIRKKNQERIEIHGNIFKIGKDKKYVDYCISDNPAISKSHADIVKQGDAYFLIDHHSLNATILNGRKIPPKELMPLHIGDKITLANEQFDFCQ